MAPPNLYTPIGRPVTHATRWALLVGLMILCLVPRAIMAWKIGGICPDATLYIRLAESLDHGDLAESLHAVRFNLFPVILMLLHRAGLPWEAAGAWWGVLISSCTVLPLYGWIRRQFDDRLALAACFLYAVHPGLIRWSPEVIRDPTFWFLFTLSLYWLWRAVTELRWQLAAAAGAAMALASMTRFEGALLLVPLVLWSFWRGRARPDLRRRLVLAGVLAVGVYPMLLGLVGAAWFRLQAPWQLVRTEPLELARGWAQPDRAPVAIARSPAGRAEPGPPSLPRRIELFASGLVRGITPVFLLGSVLGLTGASRLWRRPDLLPLAVTGLLLLPPIWIHLWWAHETCPRYFYPIVILMSPLAAMGLVRVSGAIAAWVQRAGVSRQLSVVSCAVPAVAVLAVGLIVSLGNDLRFRAATAELGQWARREIGASPLTFGPDGVTQVVNYYARGQCQSFPTHRADDAVAAEIERLRPDLVLLPADGKTPGGSRALIERIQRLGFVEVDRSQFSGGCRKVLVLRRRDGLRGVDARRARRPAAGRSGRTAGRAFAGDRTGKDARLPRMDCDFYLLLMPAVTFAAVAVLVPPVRAVARRAGIFAYPDRIRRFHPAPVPLWGGVAVYLALLVGILAICLVPGAMSQNLANLCRALIPAAGLACLFGALDDRWDLPPRLKLVLQLFAVTPIVAAGYSVDFLVIFGWHIDLGWFGIPLTILWLLGCINALNLIDGMDGLASMVGLSTAAMMGLVALSMGNGHVATIAFLLAGALAGFLVYNLPPASIYLGDSGSTLIGLIVGILGIEGSLKSSATLSITAPAVVMTLPIFDVLMALVRRRLTGRPFDVGDREHIHHRLLQRGLGPYQVLCVIGAVCLATGAAATAATIFRIDALAWITATTLIVLLVRLRLFGHHEFGLVRGALRHNLQRFARRLLGQDAYNPTPPEETAPGTPETTDKIPDAAGTPLDDRERRRAA